MPASFPFRSALTAAPSFAWSGAPDTPAVFSSSLGFSELIELRQAIERADGRHVCPGEICVSLVDSDGQYTLCVRDNGVGMTRSVVQKYLIGVGSDFWNSVDFYKQFGKAGEGGFRPIGKFGIGFLSVFMLGARVEVETESLLNRRLKLELDGLGKRGILREMASTGRVGTEVRVVLDKCGPELSRNLVEVVRARAPMLGIPLTVNSVSGKSPSSVRIEPRWWRSVSEENLLAFVHDWRWSAHRAGGPAATTLRRGHIRFREDEYYERSVDVGGKWVVKGWPGAKP